MAGFEGYQEPFNQLKQQLEQFRDLSGVLKAELFNQIIDKIDDQQFGTTTSFTNPLIELLEMLVAQSLEDVATDLEKNKLFYKIICCSCRPSFGPASSRSRLVNVVEKLLGLDIDPNYVPENGKDQDKPLYLAVSSVPLTKEIAEIIKLLVQHPNTELTFIENNEPQTVLQLLVGNWSAEPWYVECLEDVLQNSTTMSDEPRPRFEIDAKDNMGNTSLHCATNTGNKDVILLLLKHGANMLLENEEGTPAIVNIQPSTLESYFDSCIRLSRCNDASSKDFAITFIYEFLFAPPNPPNPGQQTHAVVLDPTVFQECRALRYLNESPKHRHLLKHPLVASFLELKWHGIRKFYWANLFLHALTTVVLSIYFVMLHTVESKSIVYFSILIASRLLVIVFLGVREILQIFLGCLRYFCEIQNFMEIGLVMLSIPPLLKPYEPNSTTRECSAVAMILSWSLLLILIRYWPRFSTRFAMFTAVSRRLRDLILLYSCLLIGFFLSFFLLFGPDKDEGGNMNSAWIKTVEMISGVLPMEYYPFNQFPVSSVVIFLLFSYSISMILLNLLTGMAVDDILISRKQTETIAYVGLFNEISWLESLLTDGNSSCDASALGGNRVLVRMAASWCKRTPFHWIRTKLLRLSIGNDWFDIKKRVLVFSDCFQNRQLTIYPNDPTKQVSRTNSTIINARDAICSCHKDLEFETRILQEAISISQRQPETNVEELSKSIAKLEASLQFVISELRRIRSFAEE